MTSKYFNQSLYGAGSFRLPPNAYNPLRQRYDAMSILAYIADTKRMDVDLRIGLVDVDICYVSSKMGQITNFLGYTS